MSVIERLKRLSATVKSAVAENFAGNPDAPEKVSRENMNAFLSICMERGIDNRDVAKAHLVEEGGVEFVMKDGSSHLITEKEIISNFGSADEKTYETVLKTVERAAFWSAHIPTPAAAQVKLTA